MTTTPGEALDHAMDEVLAEGVSKRQLRQYAMLRYTTDPLGLSIRDMHAQHPFSTLAKSTLEKWSSEDKWVVERDRVWARWREHAARAIGREVTRQLVQTFRQIKRLQDDAFKALVAKKDKPKKGSWESIAKLWMELAKTQMQWSQTILQRALPEEEAAASAALADDTDVSPEEMDLARRALLPGETEEEVDSGSAVDES